MGIATRLIANARKRFPQAPHSASAEAVQISPVSIPDCGRDLVKRFRRPSGHETICSSGEAIFAAREERLKPTPDNNAAEIGTREDRNETAFSHGCISNARLCSAFGSDKVNAANAAFRCRRGGMEMQHLGVDSNHLHDQPRCPLQLAQLTSDGFCAQTRASRLQRRRWVAFNSSSQDIVGFGATAPRHERRGRFVFGARAAEIYSKL
jgi:hypothetical protein